MTTSVYEGDSFSIDHAGDDWALWRYAEDTVGTTKSPVIERLILTTSAMDELRDYFAEWYLEHRAEVRSS